MKKIIFALFTLTILASASLVSAQNQKPAPQSPEFQAMKILVGTWKSEIDHGQGPEEFTVEYRLVAGGNAIEERLFANTPKEMVTMYYDRNGKLGLTHYCTLGNRPGMLLAASSPKTLQFDFDPQSGVQVTEPHMHSLLITFGDADTIKQDWVLFQDGKPNGTHSFILKRIKS